MYNCNFKGCECEIQYVCQCLSSKTFCCEIHLEEHLKSPDRNHAFDSISPGLREWTKDGFLEFLSNEKLEKEKLMTIVLDFFAQNSDIPISIVEKYLNEIDSKWKVISDEIEKISEVSEKEESLLENPWIFKSDSDTERSEDKLSNSFDSNLRLFYNLGQLKNKRLAILNKTKNDSETEQDFRKNHALYENKISDFLLSQAYKEYAKFYQKLTSLYLIFRSKSEIKLFIYDTENQREAVKILKSPDGFRDSRKCGFKLFGFSYENSIIQLPNGELFVHGTQGRIPDNDYVACIINILDKNYYIRCLPCYGSPHYIYTAIYFNKSVYCFGYNLCNYINRCPVSARFDLEKNKWIKLAPMDSCHNPLSGSLMFKGNILFSEHKRNLLYFYSIDINSYSTIPYKFSKNTAKILINGEERLYLIECKKHGWVYESGVGDEYNWKKISLSKIHDTPCQFYTSYNKGEIYISLRFHEYFREYFKFDLSQKCLIEIACYGDSLALEYQDGKLEKIERGGQAIKLDSYYNKLGNHPFYIASRLDKIEKRPYKYRKRGDALSDLGKNLEAIESYNQAIKENPDRYYNYYLKGDILYNLGRDLEALDCYNDSIRIWPHSGYNYLCKGLVLHRLGRNIEAIDCYNEGIKLWRHLKIYFNKGVALNYLGRNAEAIDCYNEIIKSEPTDEYEYCWKGDALHKLGRNFEALECYDEAIKIEPNDAWSYYKKGRISHDFGKYLEAIEYYNEVIKFDPIRERAYGWKGSALQSLGRNIEALECYNEAIELDAKYAWAYGKKGEVLLSLGRNLEAIECINESIKQKPDCYVVLCYRAALFNDLGQVEEAAKDFNTAYDLALLDFYKNIDSNDIFVHECLELRKMLLKLLESAVKTKEIFQTIKARGLKALKILNEAEEKESINKKQRSQLIKRAIECWLLMNDYPIEEIKQIKIEVAELQKAMSGTIANLLALASSQDERV